MDSGGGLWISRAAFWRWTRVVSMDHEHIDHEQPGENPNAVVATKHRGVSILRWVAITAFGALFITDYAFDAWAKPVPDWSYWVVGAVALGTDINVLREIFLAALRRTAGVSEPEK